MSTYTSSLTPSRCFRGAALLVLSIPVLLCASSAAAQKVGSKRFALKGATAVPVGELEAVGNIGNCTATLITEELVLTAAHCVCPTTAIGGVGCDTRRNFTLTDVFPIDDPLTAVDESKTRADVTISGDVVVYPEYQKKGWQRDDYAVILLDEPAFRRVKGVVPIAVEEPFNKVTVGAVLTLVGFGRTGANCKGPPAGKRKVSLKAVFSNSEAIRFKDPQKGACPGDSGGPAINGAGREVGVASWIGDKTTYRPTSTAFTWIFGQAERRESTCRWAMVERAGRNSHQPGAAWCGPNEALSALDFDANRSLAAWDSPVVGAARCCSTPTPMGGCHWAGVEQAGKNSHQPNRWCAPGEVMTALDLDGPRNVSGRDAPTVGAVDCCPIAIAAEKCVWVAVGTQRSHQPWAEWCPPNTFITGMDLDRESKVSPLDSPIVGRVYCCGP